RCLGRIAERRHPNLGIRFAACAAGCAQLARDATMEGFMFAVRALRLAGCLMAIASAAQAQTPSQPEAAVPAPAVDSEYRIGPGDELQIFVWKNPELSTEVPVRPDGRITTPLVQDIQAQGKTTTELAASLRDALSTYIQQPVVNVVV